MGYALGSHINEIYERWLMEIYYTIVLKLHNCILSGNQEIFERLSNYRVIIKNFTRA